jgi:hypothetical protein
MTVAAMGAKDCIIRTQMSADADGNCFFTDVRVASAVNQTGSM